MSESLEKEHKLQNLKTDDAKGFPNVYDTIAAEKTNKMNTNNI